MMALDIDARQRAWRSRRRRPPDAAAGRGPARCAAPNARRHLCVWPSPGRSSESLRQAARNRSARPPGARSDRRRAPCPACGWHRAAAVDLGFGEAALPAPDRRPAEPGTPADLCNAQPVGRAQDDPSPCHMLLGAVAIGHDRLQTSTILSRDHRTHDLSDRPSIAHSATPCASSVCISLLMPLNRPRRAVEGGAPARYCLRGNNSSLFAESSSCRSSPKPQVSQGCAIRTAAVVRAKHRRLEALTCQNLC